MTRRKLLSIAAGVMLLNIGQIWLAWFLDSLITWEHDWRKAPIMLTSGILFVALSIVVIALTVIASDRNRNW